MDKKHELLLEMKNLLQDWVNVMTKTVTLHTEKMIIEKAKEIVKLAEKKSEMPCNVKQKSQVKACPFCGSDEVTVIETPKGSSPPKIYCDGCHIVFMTTDSQGMRELTVRAWNKRVY